MIYFVKVHKESNGSYWTEFPDLSTLGSEGDSLEEALINSKEALEGVLESLFDHKCEIPSPKPRKGKNWHPIDVDESIAIPIILRKLRLAHGLTLKQMAKELDITYQSYQKLETLGKANPTIKTLKKIAEVFEISVVDLLTEAA
jgi:antitoxin HicB